MEINHIKRKLAYLGTALVDEILQNPTIHQFKAGEMILKSGAYITHIPLVLSGLIKVFTRYEDKDLLLYYIDDFESCVLSFSSGIKNQPSAVYAKSENDSEVLLLPIDKVKSWIGEYPKLNSFFFNQYNVRYNDLLDTINHLIFDKLDKRVLDYLSKKSVMIKKERISITHRQIAEELGTAREVISRILKKLEKESLISITEEGILVKHK